MYYNKLVLAIGLRIEERKLPTFGLAIAPHFAVPGRRARDLPREKWTPLLSSARSKYIEIFGPLG